MDRGYDYQKFAILYVDDEPQSLKYFDKAFSKDFRILTAPGADEAWQLLEAQGDHVGMVVTDQRMPGQTGVDLLGRLRRERPKIIRIITTAYAELDDAIEAVNAGEVYRYITKPWDIRDLRVTLKRAMEFFLIQRERDILLREKLSVLQRMIILDRVRSFTVLAASLTCRIRNSMTALKAFFDFAPVSMNEQAADASVKWGDLWTLAQHESQRLVSAVDEVLNTTIGSDYAFTGTVSIDELLRQQTQKIFANDADGRSHSVRLVLDEGLSPLKGDTAMIERLMEILLRRMTRLVDQGHLVEIRAFHEESVAGASGIHVTIRSDAPAWSAEQVASLFAAMRAEHPTSNEFSMDVLAAFFIAHHHGGYLVVHPAPPQGPGFDVLLPFDPEAVAEPPLDTDWLNRVFTNLEVWGHAGAAI